MLLCSFHFLGFRCEDSCCWDTDRLLPSWKIQLYGTGSENKPYLGNQIYCLHVSFPSPFLSPNWSLCLTLQSLFEQCCEKGKKLLALLNLQWGRNKHCAFYRNCRGRKTWSRTVYKLYLGVPRSTSDGIKELLLIFLGMTIALY